MGSVHRERHQQEQMRTLAERNGAAGPLLAAKRELIDSE
jgi:hypothetical protein